MPVKRLAKIKLSVLTDPTETAAHIKKSFHAKYPTILPSVYIKHSNPIDPIHAEVLPSNPEPNLAPSNAVEKFLEAKRIQHEDRTNRIKTDMTLVNKDVEHAIQNKSKRLKRHLKDSAKAIEDGFEMINHAKTRIHHIFITREEFEKVLQNIEYHSCTTKRNITEYYEFLQGTEMERSTKFKAIFKEAYKDLHEISYQLPYPLQEFFENEIMNINEITLSNYRCYADIHLQLQLKLENDSRLWLQEYQHCRELYITNRKEFLKKILNVDQVSEDTVFTNRSQEPSTYIYDNKGQVITMELLKNTVSSIMDELIQFDSYINHLKNKTRIVIEKAFQRNYDEIQHVALQCDIASNPLNNTEIKEECFNSFFIDPIRKEITPFTQKALENYESILQNIRQEVAVCEQTLTSTLHIWDEHFDRIFLSKELCLLDLDCLLGMHAESEDAEIEKINIFIDQLREATTEAELNGLLYAISNAYESIHKTINSNHEKELAFFKKFINHSEIDIGILKNEMQMFLEKNKEIAEVDPTLQRGRLSQLEVVETPKVTLISQFEYNLKGLKNWLYGLKEMIILALQKCESDFMDDVQIWIQSQHSILERNKTMKKALYTAKFRRINNNLYKLRMAEIRQHNEQLEAHKKGVSEEISNLKLIKDKYDGKFEEIIEKFKETMEQFSERAKTEKKSNSIRFLINTLALVKRSSLEKLEKTQEEYLEEIENKMTMLKHSSVQYLQGIKLFNEEGNYNGTEAKLIKTELLKLDKSINKEVAPITKDIEKAFTKIIQTFDLSHSDLDNTLINSEKELIFLETYLAEMKRIRINIKNTTFDLRKKYKALEYYYEHLKDEAEKRCGEIDYLQDFVLNAECTEQAFDIVRSLLMQRKLFKFKADIFNKEIANPESDNFYIKDNLTQLVHDFTNVNAFGEPTNGKDYMSAIINLLSISYRDLREKAKEFYMNKTSFINTGVIIENLQDFLVSILAKYLYYQLQCEQVWLEVCFDYLMLVDKVTKFIKNYYVETIISFLEINLSELRRNCFEAHTEIEDNKENVQDRYLQLLKKLKPLHGHPSNASLLESLHTEMHELEEYVVGVQLEAADKYEAFKQNSLENLVKVSSDAKQIETQLNFVIKKYVSSLLNDAEFFTQVKDRILYLQTIIEKTYILEGSKSCDIIEDLNNKLEEFKKGLHITSERSLELFSMLSKIEMSMSDCSSSTFSCSGTRIEDIIDEYKEKQDICTSKLNEALTFNVIIDTWKEQWRDEVGYIKQLYTVKYNIAKSKLER